MVKRLIAMTCALAVAAGACCAYVASSGFDRLGADDLQVAYPNYDEVSNWDFMAVQYESLEAAGMSPELVLGSSELKSAPAGAAHPARLFSDGRFGPSAVIAGRAGCNDLWQAIELGAFSDRLPPARRRAVVFTSMQWFMCYRDPVQSFPGVFSQGAYDAFMANGRISADLKRRVAERVRAYGVDAAMPSDPLARAIGQADRVVLSVADNLRLGRKLQVAEHDAGGKGGEAVGSHAAAGGASGTVGAVRPDAAAGLASPVAPDWERLFSESESAAREASTNEYGFADRWYAMKFDRWLAGARRNWRVEDGVYFSRQEFEDFELMLEVCRACEIEPLIVIQPVKGAAYDRTIYTREVRAQYYEMIRDACERADVSVADFSAYEYDRYFLRDHSHPSPLGSAYYAKGIYDFWMNSAR